MSAKASCHGQSLGAIEVDAEDFPDLPARVPPGEHLEGVLAEAQWRFWTTQQRLTESGWADLPEVRGWSDTVPLALPELRA